MELGWSAESTRCLVRHELQPDAERHVQLCLPFLQCAQIQWSYPWLGANRQRDQQRYLPPGREHLESFTDDRSSQRCLRYGQGGIPLYAGADPSRAASELEFNRELLQCLSGERWQMGHFGVFVLWQRELNNSGDYLQYQHLQVPLWQASDAGRVRWSVGSCLSYRNGSRILHYWYEEYRRPRRFLLGARSLLSLHVLQHGSLGPQYEGADHRYEWLPERMSALPRTRNGPFHPSKKKGKRALLDI